MWEENARLGIAGGIRRTLKLKGGGTPLRFGRRRKGGDMDEISRLSENGLKSALTGAGVGLVADALPACPTENTVCLEVGEGNGKGLPGIGGNGGGKGLLVKLGGNGGNGKGLLPAYEGNNGKGLIPGAGPGGIPAASGKGNRNGLPLAGIAEWNGKKLPGFDGNGKGLFQQLEGNGKKLPGFKVGELISGIGGSNGHGKISEIWGKEREARSVLFMMERPQSESAKRLAFRMNAYKYRIKYGKEIRGIMAEDLTDFVVRKKEEHYIDRFKNQNALMKKFGEEGIKVYVVLDENKTMGQMLQEAGVTEDRFVEILEFMDNEGMIAFEHSMPETALLRPPVPSEKKPEVVEQKKEVSKAPAAPASSKIQITMATEGDEDLEAPLAPPPPKTPPVPGIMRDDSTTTPLSPGYPQDKLLQPRSGLERSRSTIEIKQASEEVEKPAEEEAARPEDLLSPLEKIIYNKFGREGVEVYNLIDGEKTAEQILRDTGISETRLVEILEFMDDEGIIKLEKPGKAKGETGPREERKEVQFEPILDDKDQLGVEPVPLEERTKNVPIGLPVPQPVNFFTRMETKLKLSLKYPGKGQKLLNAIDGKKDAVALSKELGMTLEELDKMLVSLTKRKAVSVGPLTDQEIKDRYGADGLKVYKRYGRDGMFIYELIGREKTIKDVVTRSGIEPKRAVDIVMFIHGILGLGLSFDKRILYAQLGVKEPPT